MLLTFLDKLGGLLDRRFLIAYWMPVFLGAGLLSWGVAGVAGLGAALSWWTARSLTEQTVLGATFLFFVSVLAYLLQSLTVPVVQLYEGYWPEWLAAWARAGQQAVWTSLRQKAEAIGARLDAAPHAVSGADQQAAASFYHDYPGDVSLLRPTLLGNVLTAAEEYALKRYFLDTVPWWPRLTAVLPDTFRGQLDDALTPLVALLNLSALLGVVTLLVAAVLAWTDRSGFLLAAVVGGGAVLSGFCYSGAVSQARAYGDLIRTAFDLYRHALLKQMDIPVPDNLAEERQLWSLLTQFISYNTLPWERDENGRQVVKWPLEPADLEGKFFYFSSHVAPSGPVPPAQVIVTLQGAGGSGGEAGQEPGGGG